MDTQVSQKLKIKKHIHIDSTQAYLEIVPFDRNYLEEHNGTIILYEWKRYEFILSDKKLHFEQNEIAKSSPTEKNRGLLEPKSYVGTLSLEIHKDHKPTGVFIDFEIKSLKIDYITDYRYMLEDIADKSAELLLRAESPVTNTFAIDQNTDAETLYQRFAFISSVIDSENFRSAINRIISYPVSGWCFDNSEKPINRLKKLGRKDIHNILQSRSNVKIPDNNPLRKNYNIDTIASKIETQTKYECFDIPENRFVKFILETFLQFVYSIYSHKNAGNRLKKEAIKSIEHLEIILQNPFFKEISLPKILNLNNPVLQRREGYRELLRYWLLFDLSAKLVWEGGNDVYKAGKKDVAKLYEYWVFFKMIEIVSSIFCFDKDEINRLIEPKNDGLELILKSGKEFCIKGFYSIETCRESEKLLNVKLCYNKAFGKAGKYPSSGSWTLDMRPDITLILWPYGMDENEADKKEILVYIHFDAKYKIDNFKLLEKEPDVNNSEQNNQVTNTSAKREDFYKMHAYKDAIRRTAGAYILYPGDEIKKYNGFHEILPGLGAFPLKPTAFQNSEKNITKFLQDVIQQIFLRTSQYMKHSLNTFNIFKEEPKTINYPITIDQKTKQVLMPDEIYIIVGYTKNEKQYQWVTENKIYNVRIGRTAGSVDIDEKFLKAKYILVVKYSSEEHILLRKTKSAKILTKDDLAAKGYPEPEHNFYLVFENLEPVAGININSHKLKTIKEQYWSTRKKAPFVTKLSEIV